MTQTFKHTTSDTLKQVYMKLVFVFACMLIISSVAQAQADKIEGIWLTDKKDAKIQIYKAKDGKFYGKIVWLKDGYKDGKPKVDENNPKGNLQKNPLMGLVILKGFEKDEEKYSDGTIYDPENGKTYDCKMNYKGKTLSIRGYIGFSLFGRTAIWEKVS